MATRDDTLDPGTILGGTYKIVRRVGQGGMGQLYEAVHLRLSGRYAIKLIHSAIANLPDALVRFQREAEVTSRLRHPNIVSVLDFNVMPDGRPFLAMEFLEGVELAVEMERVGAMPLPRVLDIVGQVVSALAVAHGAGIVHRDLKPQNIFLTRIPQEERDIVKVVDFGISKVREASMKLTQDSSILGTPQYMAPEQALGKIANIDERTDEFSLAAITYELLTGSAAFQGEAVSAVLYQVVHEQPESMRALKPAIPAAVEQVVVRGLSKRREDRFATIRDFHRALLAAVTAPATTTAEAAYRATEPAITALPKETLMRLAAAAEAKRTAAAPAAAVVPVAPAPIPGVPNSRTTSTMSSVASEVVASSPPAPVKAGGGRRVPWPLVGVAAAALAAAGVFALRPGSETPAPVVTAPSTTPAVSPAPPAPVEKPTPAPPPAPAPIVRSPVSIENAPPGLRASVDGTPAELPLSLEPRDAPYRLRLEAPGRVPLDVSLEGRLASHRVVYDAAKLTPPKPTNTTVKVKTPKPPSPPSADPPKSKVLMDL
jgi:eukaryotic-like serine/threonine-protein kinase